MLAQKSIVGIYEMSFAKMYLSMIFTILWKFLGNNSKLEGIVLITSNMV